MISNIDSIFFSLDIKNYDHNNKELLQFLEIEKEESKEDRLKENIINVGDRKFIILPNGARFHAYILHNESIEIKLSQARSRSKNNYPVSVRIKSLLLWEKGFIQAYLDTIDYIKTIIQGDIIAEKISRADLCCHTDKLKFDNMLDIYENWRGTFRKVEHYFYNRELNGLTFGSFNDKNVMCRIYDKSLEIKSSGKSWFNDIWIESKMDIDNVWNVEFQVGRKYFKDYNIETVQDFIINMRGIWEHLTKTWITYINMDDSNISRCTTKESWLDIQNSYLDYCNYKPIKREKQVNKNAQNLIPLLVGVFTSYGACKQKIVLDKVIDDFKKDIDKYLYDKKDNVPIEKLFYDKLEYIYS